MSEKELDGLFREIRACTVCAAHLPRGPRPIVRGRASARLLVVSQAPGARVHETGLSFNDRSGDALRRWLGVDRDTFYDETRIAVLGIGLCYPGRAAGGGDLPPRRECAPLWHDRVLALLPRIELTLLVGSYAIERYLAGRAKANLGETVRAWRDYLPGTFPLPHPSWRNIAWLRRNPWFEREAVPVLQSMVGAALDGPDARHGSKRPRRDAGP